MKACSTQMRSRSGILEDDAEEKLPPLLRIRIPRRDLLEQARAGLRVASRFAGSHARALGLLLLRGGAAGEMSAWRACSDIRPFLAARNGGLPMGVTDRAMETWYHPSIV